MFDLTTNTGQTVINDLNPETIAFLNRSRDALKGHDRRIFMAGVVDILGPGGQWLAETILKWNRVTIRKGTRELKSGFNCVDNFSARGRKPVEKHLPNLLDDIKDIVEPVSQVDPTFRTGNLYCPLTAKEVRKRLIEQKGYDPDQLPTQRTIRNKLNELDFRPEKVAKSKPKKKIEETDAIFENVHTATNLADEFDGVVRISIDCKAVVKIGDFSRGGYNRQGDRAFDHDFAPEAVLKLFGIHIPSTGENHFFFTQGNVTADFMFDSIQQIWRQLQIQHDPHTLLINADNGPENSGLRSQYIKRAVDFAMDNQVDIQMAYYPPYHSKYNPIERVWGVLENHWRGELLTSIDKALALARTMTWKGIHPVVHLVKGIYEKGVKLGKKAMAEYEKLIERKAGLEKWSIFIPGFIS